MISSLEAFNATLQAAQVECEGVDAEISQLQRNDPEASEKYLSLVDRRRQIGERILSAVEALGAPLAPETAFSIGTQ
jgi:hypothetical protein